MMATRPPTRPTLQSEFALRDVLLADWAQCYRDFVAPHWQALSRGQRP